jgi:cytochrome c-type biogenesis protein CcmF
MVDIGSLALAIAWVLALYAIVMSLAGAYRRKRDFIASAEHASLAVWGLVTLAGAALLHALVTHDFNLEYVAHYSSSTLPLQYTIAALWGGQSGSMLFWLMILTSMAAVVLLQNRERNRELMPYVNAVLMVVAFFFLSMVVFVTPPFQRLAFTPAEGHDLNPLLQNYWMTIHPPALYLGYVGCAVPFAFAMGALVTGKLGDEWIRTTRRWTLLAWFFLSMGNLFGAEWAYGVLGWGGYWAWDPVENAAFMPWLTCTAFLHSVMIQEKKNMLKIWNMVLVILTFALTIFGTFLTRSGVISSVHSFTQSGLGPFFMIFLAATLAVSIGLLIWRLPQLRSENELDSVLSRESAFLLNNLILVGIAFAVFWGTVFPVISEAVRGIKITVGPPFFNKVNAPLGLILLFLTGVGPVIAWRRASARNLERNFLIPVSLGLLAGIILFAAGVRHYYAIVSLCLCVFVLATIVMEFHRGIRARQAMVGENPATALLHLISKNRRRYGGYIIHLGVVMMFLGITGTSAFREEKQITVKAGDSFPMGGYTLRYNGVTPHETQHIAYLTADIGVFENGHQIDTLRPEKRFYKKPEQPTTEVAIRSTVGADLYVVLGSYDEASRMATIQAYVNPLVSWLWWGGVVLVIGTIVTIVPSRAPAGAPAYAPSRAGRAAATD